MKKSTKSSFIPPFKSPSNSTTPSTTATTTTNTSAKKTTTTTTTTTKKSPTTLTTSKISNNNNDSNSNDSNKYFKVMWCAKTTKKNKTYNDGILVYNSDPLKGFVLQDDTGKDIGRPLLSIKLQDIKPDYQTTISSKEVNVVEEISPTEYYKLIGQPISTSLDDNTSTSTTTSLNSKFKGHGVGTISTIKKRGLTPYYNPNSPDSLVLYYPPESGTDESGTPVTHVVVDPFISKHLRPHQRVGVQFLFDCVSGIRHPFGNGAILADQMGLGKTLQTLTLLWTALKQSPTGSPLIKKAIIVTPSTLVGNWKNEIQRWFGVERIRPMTLTDSVNKKTKQMMEEFKTTNVSPVLIISYEQCRIFASLLESTVVGLLICDEGHRLKNTSSKTSLAIQSIKASRKVILSGTPIQNDLLEFYAMVDFCNPGSLGSQSSFKKKFSQPITKSRENIKTSNYDDDECIDSIDPGYLAAKELSQITNQFILRRKSTILEQYLPPKKTFVIFCKMIEQQESMYKKLLKSRNVQSLLTGNGGSGSASSLSMITKLKKLCNSPSLLYSDQDEDDLSFPDEYKDESDSIWYQDSGKLQFINSLLDQLKIINEKVVLVSNYTQTLDVFEKLCKSKRMEFLRLDGQVNSDQRQQLVDKFNDPTNKTHSVFLLSAKAGGVGINLIGGNHIVLFDPDWNPAVDIQAMERVWREGQTKPVSIYRLLCTGTIEEKIYQRQLMKESISNSVVDNNHSEKSGFSLEDLRDIFSYNQDTDCDTHDLLSCDSCQQKKSKVSSTSSKATLLQKIQHTDKWDHFSGRNQLPSGSTILKNLKNLNEDIISFIFTSKKTSLKHSEEENKGDSISFFKVENDYTITDEIENDDTTTTTTKTKNTVKKKTTKKIKDDDIIDDLEENPVEQDEDGEDEEEIKPAKKRLKKKSQDSDSYSDLEFE
eukprot:gene1400-1769_t